MNSALRELLDEEKVSTIAEYLSVRLELDRGDTMLQLEFSDGRYDRMHRYDKWRASSLRSEVTSDLGGRAGSS